MFIPQSDYDLILRNIPVLCVDLLIVYDNKCLLLKRENEPAKGEFWFAGGRVRKFETLESAAIRIAKEETNLECEFIKIVSVEQTIFSKKGEMVTDIHTINICCHMIPKNIKGLMVNRFHLDYQWVNSIDRNYNNYVNHPLILLGFSNSQKMY